MKIGGDQLIVRFWNDVSGATAIEYGVLIGMIFVIVAGIAGLGGHVGSLYNSIAQKAVLALNF